jgi:hypothetical protein
LIWTGTLALAMAVVPAAAAAQANEAAGDPWGRYREYLGQTRMGDVQPYLTDEGQAQFRAYSEEAKSAARGLLYSLSGLYDATLVKSTVDGKRARLDAIIVFVPMPGNEHKDNVKAAVEMTLTSRGWTVRSETFTPTSNEEYYARALSEAGWTSEDGKSWTSLRAPGVFPPSVENKADAERRDQESGDGWAIGDVRTVISAQAAYQSVNGGFYDTLECLRGPGRCIPSYPANAPVFLEAATATPRNGYRARFDPGPAAEKTPVTSPSSLTSYAVWMIPDEGRPGRTLCGDHTGIVCTVEGRTPPATKGACPVAPGPCRPLN